MAKLTAEQSDRAIAALRALVDKLDAINEHPSYEVMVCAAFAHGVTYDGPSWTPEHAAAKNLLHELEA